MYVSLVTQGVLTFFYRMEAIYLEDGATFNMSGGVISGHSETYGGAVYIAAAGTNLQFNNCNFTDNKGTNGGAINWQRTYGMVSKSNFINNTAVKLSKENLMKNGKMV